MEGQEAQLAPAVRPFLALLLFAAVMLRAAAFDHTHTRLAKVLSAHVVDGAVDYAALKSAPDDLRAYLDGVAAVKEDEFKAWTQPLQIAFLVNLYNAATLQLIVDHYPTKSIKDIGGVLSSPWKQPVVRLWGRVTTLDEVEHGLLRARYSEPRIHFALVCAAKSCPPLRSEPFTAEKLDTQLTEQARKFFAQTAKNRVDADRQVLWLSPIFDWFHGDFTKDGKSVEEFVAPFFPEAEAKRIRAGGLKVKYTEYDWALNGK